MKSATLKSIVIVAALAAAGAQAAAQESPAKLWREIDQLLPRKNVANPVVTPSGAIDWPEKISKAEEIMVRAGGTPVEPFAMYYLASFYFETGRFDEAKAMFETIQSQFPNHALVTLRIAKDAKPLVVQAVEDCASEISWRARHPRPPVPVPVLDDTITATIHFSTGDVKIGFYKNVAPRHVENFIQHAKAGDYDGTKVGQIIQDALVAAGDPASKQGAVDPKTGQAPQGPTVPHEFSTLSHTRGMVAMARSTISNESSGMLFQVVLKDQPYFDFTQTIFGRVLDGLQVVDAISKQPRGMAPNPATDVTIKGVTIDQK